LHQEKIFTITTKPYSIAWKIFSINVMFFLIGIYINDPFGFFQSHYLNADSFLSKKDEIVEIRILSSQYFSKLVGWNSKLIKNKKNDTWQVKVNDHSLHGDMIKIEKFLNSLRDLRKFTELGKARDEYGFEEESYFLEIYYANEITTKIEISSTIPQSGGSYISDSEGIIYFVPDHLNTIFNNQDYSYFADRTIFSPITFNSVTSFKLIHFNSNLGKNESFIFNKDSGFWFLKEDLQIKVNPDTMQDILIRLNGLEIMDFDFKLKKTWKPIQEYTIHFSSKDYNNGKWIELNCKWLDENSNIVCQREAKEFIILDRYNFERIFSYTKNELIIADIK
jgi:hypothetical protein